MSLTFPLAGFDLESTGTDAEHDRLVQAGFGCAERPGDWTAFARLVDPGIPIPAEASAVHHITDDMVAGQVEEGLAAQDMTRLLYGVWDRGGIVVGTNICFDFTMLDRACRRGGFDGFQIRGPVVDTYVLDKATDRFRKGSRRLPDVARHYRVPLDNAHDAEADLYAAVRIAWKIVENGVAQLRPEGRRWPELRVLRNLTAEQLHELQAEAYAEQKASLYAYFDRSGIEYTPEPFDWPIRPWQEKEEVA